MSGFIKGEDRSQATLFPERLDDYVAEDNPVRVIDVFLDDLDLSEYKWDKRYIHIRIKVPIIPSRRGFNRNSGQTSQLFVLVSEFLTGYNGVFHPSLKPGRDQPCRYPNVNGCHG